MTSRKKKTRQNIGTACFEANLSIESHWLHLGDAWLICWRPESSLVQSAGWSRGWGREDKRGREWSVFCWYHPAHRWTAVFPERTPGVFQRPPGPIFSGLRQQQKLPQESRSTFIAQELTFSPPLFLSWRPPSANVSGFSSVCASDQQGASARSPGEHLPQREPWGMTLAQAAWPLSRHCQAAFVGCFVSFLVSLC